jgi:hypothetical protein
MNSSVGRLEWPIASEGVRLHVSEAVGLACFGSGAGAYRLGGTTS